MTHEGEGPRATMLSMTTTWVPIGVLIAAVCAAGSGVMLWGTVKSDLGAMKIEVSSIEVNSAKANEVISKIGDEMREIRYDVNRALADPWSFTDQRFWIAELRRLNPTLTIPDAQRVLMDGRR